MKSYNTHEEVLETVLRKRAEHYQELDRKYPWVSILLNWITAALVAILIIELAKWGFQENTIRKANALTATALAEYQAEQELKEQEKQAAFLAEINSEAAKREKETVLLAKVLVGINAFVEKYGYSDGDIRTYGECVLNRVLNEGNGFGNTVEDVIMQPSQWTGFSENNQVVDKYYKIASLIINNFYDGVTRPCTSSYCWAELRRDGVWLKDEYSDSPYVHTWRYSA